MAYQPKKIISGGQTGADVGGLVGAESAGIPTGGTAPRDFQTEKGPQPKVLMERFGLMSHPSRHYNDRTLDNVKSAHATLIFATRPESDGTQFTIACCEKENKPYCLVDPNAKTVKHLVTEFLVQEKPTVLNIAGNRESISPGICARVATIIKNVFAE
jgi:hypothetical protein